MIYKLQRDPMTNKIDAVNKIDGNKIIGIPFDESNRYYQEYLEWLSEGNTPEEAE
jgi:hypothetical protein